MSLHIAAFPVSPFVFSTPQVPSTAENPQPLRVVTRVIEPFVIDEGNGKYSGYSMELLDLIHQELKEPSLPAGQDYALSPQQKAVINLPFAIESQPAANAEALVKTVQDNGADLGIASISITQDREARVDFSLPMYSSGLQVMQTTDKAPGPNIMTALGHILSRPKTPAVLWLGFIGMATLATLIYLFEQRHSKSFLFGEPPLVGIGNAFWWGLTVLVGQEEAHPRSSVSRLAATLIMATGVIVVALFTASVASDLTLQQLDDPERGIDSLNGHVVVTLDGTTSESYLDQKRVELKIKAIKTVGTLDDAYAMLKNGQADSLVYDAPVLQYYASHQGRGKFTTVGRPFHSEYYGIVLPQGSPWREPISRALLTLSEDGTLDHLAQTYLGDASNN
ncbi:MAG TPA: transporter substrate-binding domain-containing protein [Candidatus Saccharimonadia bacterium]|nr:transporter substrate-binding domain-containing protein [Candidatus Saccharimonadia bacterium]